MDINVMYETCLQDVLKRLRKGMGKASQSDLKGT